MAASLAQGLEMRAQIAGALALDARKRCVADQRCAVAGQEYVYRVALAQRGRGHQHAERRFGRVLGTGMDVN